MSTMDGLQLMTVQAAMACLAATPFYPKGRIWHRAEFSEQKLAGARVLVRLTVELVRTERDDRDHDPEHTYVLLGEVTAGAPDAPPTWHSSRIYQIGMPKAFYSLDVNMTGTSGLISVRENQQLRLMPTCGGELFGGGSPRWWTGNAALPDTALAEVMARLAEEIHGEYGFRFERLRGGEWELVRAYTEPT